jgi:hypothetical protein
MPNFNYMVVYTTQSRVGRIPIKVSGFIDADTWTTIENQIRADLRDSKLIVTNIISLPIKPNGPIEMDV